jgi:hypothetical protein
MKYKTPKISELKTFCDDSNKRLLKVIDTIFDKCDTSKAEVKLTLIEASKILKEIEQLEEELNNIILK